MGAKQAAGDRPYRADVASGKNRPSSESSSSAAAWCLLAAPEIDVERTCRNCALELCKQRFQRVLILYSPIVLKQIYILKYIDPDAAKIKRIQF